MSTTRKSGYPSDVTDEQWDFLLSYFTLMSEDAPQRQYPLRDLFNAVRYVVRTGVQWRYLPHNFPPWSAVSQQARRWRQASVFEAIAHDLRIIERVLQGREADPSATVLDARTLQSTPESGGRAGYDGHRKKHGSKVHLAVDTLGNLLSIVITAANEQERDQMGKRAEKIRELTNGRVKLAYVDQGYTGERAADADAAHEIELEVVKHTEAKKGFVLLPRRWVVERTFGWLGRHRRLARDYERLTKTLAAYHWVTYLGVMLQRLLNESA